ncbi:MAG: hypothetical protein AB1805_07150 [Nitrospirota bacterium]
MHEIIRKINASNDVESVCCVLEELFRESESVLSKNEMTIDQALGIIGAVTRIRGLLTELARIETSRERKGRTADVVLHLNECYAALEGAVKEARNDMMRSSKGGPGSGAPL